ncbi:MAG TPA: hypothetical protein VK670_08865 [Silvibacterium sp.]|nr:hypothetical protein [Silvibacterium sp.]
MSRFFVARTYCCLTALFLPLSNHGHAQIAIPMGQDQQPNTNIMLAPMPGPAQIGVLSTRGGFALQENAETVRDQPYQAQATTEIKQTLADGAHIVQTTSATVARDSEGRTVRIQKLSTIGPWKSKTDSEGSSTTLTSIFDPVAKEHIDYTSDTKVAHEMPLPPELPSGTATTVQANGFAVGSSAAPTVNMVYSVQSRAGSPPPDKEPGNTTTESLGTKTIDGIQATGTRNVNTIPAGSIGNDKDIVVTRETWYSPELKLVIQSTQNDPRFGETAYSLTNIQRNEPDEALFQIPAGYRIDKPHVILSTRPQ